MATVVSATKAARTFSNLVNRVRYRGESFVVERGGEAVCQIGPVAVPRRSLRDVVQALREGPHPDAEYLDVVETVVAGQPKLPKSPWGR